MEKYYAAYAICPDEIAIFEKKEDRDNWLAYKDVLGDDRGLRRIGLTEEQARILAGDALDDERQYIGDEYLHGVSWLILHDADTFDVQDYLLGETPDVESELALLASEYII